MPTESGPCMRKTFRIRFTMLCQDRRILHVIIVCGTISRLSMRWLQRVMLGNRRLRLLWLQRERQRHRAYRIGKLLSARARPLAQRKRRQALRDARTREGMMELRARYDEPAGGWTLISAAELSKVTETEGQAVLCGASSSMSSTVQARETKDALTLRMSGARFEKAEW